MPVVDNTNGVFGFIIIINVVNINIIAAGIA
jgi:hypothetical protein